MSVSAVSGSSSSAQSATDIQAERVVLALKKQQDAQKAQAEGLLQLIEQAAPPQAGGVGRLISVYA
jgi:Putative motility protein